MDSIDLDLDAVEKQTKKIKLNGEIIEISAPDVLQLIKLMKLGSDMKSGNMEDMEGLIDTFQKLIPELEGKPLRLDQFFALVPLVVEMAEPANLSELEKRGIKVDIDPKKKQGLDSQGKSLSS